jgi:hypothetical protein
MPVLWLLRLMSLLPLLAGSGSPVSQPVIQSDSQPVSSVDDVPENPKFGTSSDK